jgi:hypothetical protein
MNLSNTSPVSPSRPLSIADECLALRVSPEIPSFPATGATLRATLFGPREALCRTELNANVQRYLQMRRALRGSAQSLGVAVLMS